MCTLTHGGWHSMGYREGRKNGAPALSRVLAEAEGWRREEFPQAQNALEAVGQRKDLYAMEVARVAHDALGAGHGRDYRRFALFY